MTDSTIGVAEPGTPTKLLQSYQNAVSSQTVQAEGVVQVDLNGVPVPRGSAADPVRVDPTGATTQPVRIRGVSEVSPNPDVSVSVVPVGFAPLGLQSNRLEVVGATYTTAGAGTTLAPWLGDNTSLGFAINLQNLQDGNAQVGIVSSVTYIKDNLGNTSQLATATDNGAISSAAQRLPTIPARANASAPAWTEGRTVPLSTDLSGNLRASLATLPNPSNLPLLSLDPQGSLQVNNNNLRAIEERIMMLAELAAVNSLIASDNGPGARNYQEMR